jgi:uracil-DNA glycosylase family 4
VAAETSSSNFDPDCRRCPRLAGFLDDVRQRFPAYWSRPVPSFGAAGSRLLIVGLAPGLHGANATGRPFTGDYAGILLYQALHEFGLASHPASTRADDELLLHGCRITNAVRCVPPENKPSTAEVRTCNGYLRHELEALPPGAVVLALGAIAHGAVLRARGHSPSRFPFAHGRRHALPCGLQLFDSYHCSRYNTQTRRLTPDMFRAVFTAVCGALGAATGAPA